MNSVLKKMILTLMAMVWIIGCSQGKPDNSDNIDALKAHMKTHDQSISITPVTDAYASLMDDAELIKTMVDEANANYAKLNINNMYLVTGATFESNETLLGSLIHFKRAMTAEEAKLLLSEDETFKDQISKLITNGNFAFAVATSGGKVKTPKSVIEAFKNFK